MEDQLSVMKKKAAWSFLFLALANSTIFGLNVKTLIIAPFAISISAYLPVRMLRQG
jgi:hypothetical protein